jgi:hypothetical protein
MSARSLEKRIAATLGSSDATSTDLAALIAETEAAIIQAEATAEVERAKALDPVVSPDASEAREAMQAAEFSRDRLRTVLPRLQVRYEEIAAAEFLTQWRADYEVLKVKRDALAAELGELYPDFVTKIVALLGRVAANDAELFRLHQARPGGAGLHLLGAELTARGLEGFSREEPSITKELQLPDWANSAKMAWPPRQFDPALFAPVQGDPRRHSADWWQVKEEEARAQRERHEREEVDALAKRRENWHGPLWEKGQRVR